jgi:hypothetical protein
MMSEIYSRGPITCSMAVPHILDWDYRGGVYIDHSNSTIKEIDHDVEVRLPLKAQHPHVRNYFVFSIMEQAAHAVLYIP